MGLKMPHTTKSLIPGDYFNIQHWRGVCSPGEPDPRYEVYLGFYVSEEARRMDENPAKQYIVKIPFNKIPSDFVMNPDPREGLYTLLKSQQFFLEEGGALDVLEDPAVRSLEVEQLLKKEEITQAKVQANESFFVFEGRKFQADAASMLQIQVTMNGVLARGTLREDWNGAWLDIDNKALPIPDVATWMRFYASIETTGQANFDYARALKARVDQCVAVNQVRSIFWGMPLDMALPDPLASSEPLPTPLPPPDPAPEPEPEPIVVVAPSLPAMFHDLNTPDDPEPEPEPETPALPIAYPPPLSTPLVTQP